VSLRDLLGKSDQRNQPRPPQTALRLKIEQVLALVVQEIPPSVSGLFPLEILKKSALDMLNRTSEQTLINGVRQAGAMVRELEAAIPNELPRGSDGAGN
jgi:hypothetical protein